MIITVLIAVPLGVIAAYRHGSWIDRLVVAFSVIGFSVPVFVLGYLLIYLFALELKLLGAGLPQPAPRVSGRSSTD